MVVCFVQLTQVGIGKFHPIPHLSYLLYSAYIGTSIVKVLMVNAANPERRRIVYPVNRCVFLSIYLSAMSRML